MIHVACPACGARARAPDDYAGATVRCKKCGGQMILPGAPPPAPAPSPGLLATQPILPSPEDSLEEVGKLAEAPGLPPEPWYYRFLQTLTTVFLWVTIIGAILGLLGWLLWVILVLFGVAGITGGTRDVGAGIGALLIGLFATVPYLIALVVWFLLGLMTACWSYLVLDAARNLRVMRYTARR